MKLGNAVLCFGLGLLLAGFGGGILLTELVDVSRDARNFLLIASGIAGIALMFSGLSAGILHEEK